MGGSQRPAVQEDLKRFMSEEERLEEARTRMAELGTMLLGNPEENVNSLLELQQFCMDRNTNIVKMAMLSLLAIFKDIIPGYRIRLPTSKEMEMQVSKDVRKLREFEMKLLGSYQKFIQFLSRAIKSTSHLKTSIHCVCLLLETVPHFNYRDTLLSITVSQMDSSNSDHRKMSCAAMRSLFQNEGKHGGIATTEAVELIADLVKTRNCVLHPDTIQVFMALSFNENISRPIYDNMGKDRMNNKANKKVKRPEEVKSQKPELLAKLREEVVADFKESTAVPDPSEGHRLQTRTLAVVFETYFRILKASLEPNTRSDDGEQIKRVAEYGPHPLLRPCLDGLGKLSHFINVEFMADMLAVLKRLALETHPQHMDVGKDFVPVSFSDRLHSCVTAFNIVQSNLNALNVDLKEFYSCLYDVLANPNFVRDDHDGEILAEALQVMLWDSRQHDMQRVAAFVKRLASISLHCGSAEAMTALVTVQYLLRRYRKCCNLLENDGSGGTIGGNIAVFKVDGTDPDTSGALSSVLWELSILSRHYHPTIRKLANQLCTLDSTSSQVLLATLKPKDVYSLFSDRKGGFHPSVQPPRKRMKRKPFLSQKNDCINLTDVCFSDDVEMALDEEKTVQLFAKYFKVIQDIKENERLRRELTQVVTSIRLFKKLKLQRGKGK